MKEKIKNKKKSELPPKKEKKERENWFSNRVSDIWNGLRNQVVSAKTIKSFKRRLDKYMIGDDRWK